MINGEERPESLSIGPAARRQLSHVSRCSPAGSTPTLALRCPDKSRRTVAGHLRFAAQHSAEWCLDSCYSDYATTNAQQVHELLGDADVPMVPPQG
jgi:hypothetical protein